MKKYALLFCLFTLTSTTSPETSFDPSKKLFLAIAQGNARRVKKLLLQGISVNTQRLHGDGNSPLMDAIIALGEKLMEMETTSLAQELSHPKNMTEDFRSFLRSVIVSILIGFSAGEIQNNIENINNDANHATITILKSVSRSFVPVVSRSAYLWCAFCILDYGIVVGRKDSNDSNHFNSNSESQLIIEQFRKNIHMLLSDPTININQLNHQGESALSFIRHYKEKVKSERLRIILYQVEQILISEGAYHVENYSAVAQPAMT